MDKNTLSNYGWIVIAVLVLAVMIALATPFGSYIKTGVENTTQGLFDTSEKALNVVGMTGTTPTILDSGKCGDNLNWELLSDGTLHISGTGPMYDYVKFTKPAPWYKYRNEPYLSDDGITILNPDGSVYMEDSTYLGNNPNGWHYNKIVIDEGVTYIGDWAFYRVCVDELTIPEGVTETGIFCVRYSPTLKTLNLPNSLKIIDDFGISRNMVMTALNIGNGLETVGTGGFRDNYKLKSIILPESCTSVNTQLSPSYTGAEINYNATGLMENCTELKNVVFGNVDKIPQRTCLGTSVENIVIPNTVKSIDAYAFYNCTSLKTVTFEQNSICTSISDNAFQGCTELQSITGGIALKGIGSYSTNNKLHTFDFSDTNTSLLKNQFNGTSIKTASISSNITSIPSGWIAYNSSLETVYISNSVTEILSNAFNRCTALTSIHYDGTIDEWNAISKTSGWNYLVNSGCRVYFNDNTSELLSKIA